MPTFKVIEGTTDVLISAPHVFGHGRPSMAGVLKQGEKCLDGITQQVCQKTKTWGIYSTADNADFDPNFHQIGNNPYKEEISRLLSEKKISKVIDLHGLNDKQPFDIGIYYCMRFSRSKEMAEKLISTMSSKREFREISYHIWYNKEDRGETITEFVCRTKKYPAIQVEIARYIRESASLRQYLIDSICEFVLTI